MFYCFNYKEHSSWYIKYKAYLEKYFDNKNKNQIKKKKLRTTYKNNTTLFSSYENVSRFLRVGILFWTFNKLFKIV